MKTKLSITLLLGLLTIAFIFNSVSEKALYPQPNEPDGFILGAMDCAWDGDDYTNMTELNFNLWHKYVHIYKRPDGSFVSDGWDWWSDTSGIDQVELPVNNYDTCILNRMSKNNTAGFKTLYMRPKFERLLYGQRSDYQCESRGYIADNNYRFYTYNYSPNNDWVYDYTDNSEWGNGVKVKYCHPDPVNLPSGIWIDSGLVSNNEQVRTYMGNRWEGDIIYGWLVKPRIRIDSVFANNPENFNTPVCKLEILDYEGNVIKIANLRVRNFLIDPGQTYNGRYIEEYRFVLNDTNLTIPAPALSTEKKNAFNPNGLEGTWPFSSRGESGNGQCKVDFRVYWYGECDMWIDYVRVDNDVADELFKGFWDPNIIDETTLALQGANNSVYRIYTEEFEFNNIPAFAYVNHKIDSLSNGQISLMVDLAYPAYNAHLSWVDAYSSPLGTQHISDCLIDKIGLKELFGGPYQIFGTGYRPGYVSYIPSTLPDTSGAWILASVKTPSEYDTWLQEEFDKTADVGDPFGFTEQVKVFEEAARLAGVPWINIFQAHAWKDGSYSLREPTNEEIKMMANVFVSYGTKGILYFWYGSFGDSTGSGWGRGLVDVNTDNPRHNNFYNQYTGMGTSKFRTVDSINTLLKDKWGQYLLSFSDADRHSYIYRLQDERSLLYQNSYFSDLFTYKIGTLPPSNCNDDFPQNDYPPPGCVGECKGDRYLQAATFENADEENTNYFMIVNRRCSPFINDDNETNNGGRRFIRVKFVSNHPQLNYYNTWKITEIGNDRWSIEFNKLEGDALDLGWFQPGEGKLYKMVPVMKSGGNLVADEYITSGEEFTCEDTVWTNGYNLTKEDGVN